MKIALVIYNVRSALNVGSMLRTAEGLGVDEVFMAGYTPYPETENDERLPHQRRRTTSQIHKTALGAEYSVHWQYMTDINDCLAKLSEKDYLIVALEQTPKAVELNKFQYSKNVALIVGNEVSGLDKSVLKQIKQAVQIPMLGRKESFNVAIAAGIAIYHLRYLTARQK